MGGAGRPAAAHHHAQAHGQGHGGGGGGDAGARRGGGAAARWHGPQQPGLTDYLERQMYNRQRAVNTIHTIGKQQLYIYTYALDRPSLYVINNYMITNYK